MESLHYVAAFASSLGLGSAQIFLAADCGNSRVMVMPQLGVDFLSIISDVPPESDPTFLGWENVRDSSFDFACTSAHSVLSAMTSQPWPVRQYPSPSEIDWGPQILRLGEWERTIALSDQSDKALIAALRATSPADPNFKYLSECSERVISLDRPSFNDVPKYLRKLGDPLNHPHVASLPFSSRFTPTSTARLPIASQERFSTYRPMSFGDIIEPEALKQIIDWLYIESSNMAAMAKFGPAARRVQNAVASLGYGIAIEPHEVLVIGQNQFLEPARGVVWDCRGFEHGLEAVPMDFAVAPESHLNNAFIASNLNDWPDQELVGMLIDGVQFKADLGLQIVLGPHLSSLPNAYSNVQKEIVRLTGEGYYGLHRVLPYAPMRAMPQGSTPRKLEPGRDRRTSDGGFPRRSVADTSGILAKSLNDAIGLKSFLDLVEESSENFCLPHDEPVDVADSYDYQSHSAFRQSSPKWPAKEIKPQIQDKVWDDTILRHASLFVFHEPLRGWKDDAADYFNQIPLAPSEYWVSCLFWAFWAKDESDVGWTNGLYGLSKNTLLDSPISVVSEHRLGFGVSLSSNIGQRFAEAILAIFRRRFDEEESALFETILDSSTGLCTPYSVRDSISLQDDGWTDVCRWIHERRRISIISGRNELRRYTVHMYTDDPIFSTISTDVMIRAMRCWNTITTDLGLKMALAKKRQVGDRLTWNGFNFYYSAGIVSVTPDKICRAREVVERILDGALITFDVYRKLLGLFEHMLIFVGGDRTFMYGLYDHNFRRGSLLGPTTRMIFQAVHIKKVPKVACVSDDRSWLFFLSFFRLFKRSSPNSAGHSI